jgi:hypothetical protein
MTGRSLRHRWRTFEDWAFGWIGRGERYLRGLPANARIVPGTFERLAFRIAVGAVVSMAGIMAIPTRSVRIRALLLLLLALFVLLMGAAYRDAFPRSKR